MNKISVKGVVVGGVTDIVATNLLAIPLVVYVMVTKIDIAHMSRDQMQTAILAALQANPLLYASQLIIGAGCSVLGGYVGAKLAKHDELLNGLLTSFLCVGSGIYALAVGIGPSSLLLHLAGFVASPALGLLGGYLRLVQKRTHGATLQATQTTATNF